MIIFKKSIAFLLDELKRDCDIINDFEEEIKLKSLNIEFNFTCRLNELILSSYMYNPIKIKITFDKIPKENE